MKLKCKVEKLNPYERKLKIEVPTEEVNAVRVSVITDIAKRAKLPGFRPGKVPTNVVESRFSKEIEGETLSQVVNRSYYHAMNGEKMIPVSEPSITGAELKAGSPVSYVATVEIRPDIPLKKYKGLEITKEAVKVEDSEIDHTLKHIQHQKIQFEPADANTVVEKNHFVTIDFEGFEGGKPFKGNKGTDAVVEVGINALVAGFEDNLIGLKVGDTKQFEIQIPADYSAKELAGKGVSFTVTIKKIEHKILPTLDDGFAKSVGKFDSLGALKSSIREEIHRSKVEKTARDTENQLIKELIAKNPFAAPPSMIKKQREFIWDDVSARLKSQGMPDAQLGEYEKKWDSDIREEAISKVKAGLILDEIAKKENITVTPDEVQRKVSELERVYSNNAEIKKVLKSQEVQVRIYSELLQQRVIELLMKEAKIK